MKLLDLLTEEKKPGSYAGVKFATETNKALHKYIKDNKIPNPPRPDRFHTTLLYSRKYLPKYEPLGELNPPVVGEPTELEVFNTQTGSRALVLRYKCDWLEERHNKLMDEHEATYDYPEYKVHVTLSYDIGDMDIKDLPNPKEAIEKILIVEEYGEDLDLNWAQTKGTKKGN